MDIHRRDNVYVYASFILYFFKYILNYIIKIYTSEKIILLLTVMNFPSNYSNIRELMTFILTSLYFPH